MTGATAVVLLAGSVLSLNFLAPARTGIKLALRFPSRLQFCDSFMTPSAECSTENSPAPRLRGWLLALVLSLGVALAIASPFFWLGNASGHDFQFHAASWIDVAGQWKEGIIYPRWAEWANHGFGEPRFIFYPPLSWTLGAGLSFIAPWSRVPVAYIILVQILAGLSAFAFARRTLPERAALFSAACYAANPYALLMIYLRSDFSELLATAFFPLLVLAALQLTGVLENRSRSLPRAVVFFSTVFAATWLSNAPAGVIASYAAALLFAWAVLTNKSWRPLAHGVAGLALGFGLAGFYLLPAAYEQHWVNITQALSTGLLPAENFLYTEIDDPIHTFFNWIASTAAILIVVLTAIAAQAVHREFRKREASGEERRQWGTLLILAAAAFLLMLRFTAIFWQVLPKLRFVQFPWRWMLILAVPFAYFTAAAVARRRFGWLWAAVVLALLASTGAWLARQAWWDTQDIPVLRAAITHGQGYEGTDEYDPLGDDHTDLPAKAPRVDLPGANGAQGAAPEARILIERWTAEEKELRVSSREPLGLALRLLNYPAWRVEVNGAVVTPERAEDFNQMIVPVTAGESHIQVTLTRTTDRTAGILISLASLVTVLLVIATQFFNDSTQSLGNSVKDTCAAIKKDQLS
jgi:hypothetical protein